MMTAQITIVLASCNRSTTICGNNDGCTFISQAHDLLGTDADPLDAALAPLTENGGQTQTHALQAGSPAIDAANPAPPGSGNGACEALDQRAVARPLGLACDIGAYEADPLPALWILKSGPAEALPGQPFTYTLTITNQGTLTASNLVISDELPANAFYLPGSGGTLYEDTVVWELPLLAAGGGTAQFTFAITATQTITNLTYRVTAAGGFWADGEQPVITVIEYQRIYLPLAMRSP
jgi:uncharacterized repeat protein (TIGR01451 family)